MNTCKEVGTISMVPVAGSHKTTNSPARHFVTELGDDEGVAKFLRTMETIKSGTTIHKSARIERSNKHIVGNRTATFVITIEGLTPDETTQAALVLVQRTCRHLNPTSYEDLARSMATHSESHLTDLYIG